MARGRARRSPIQHTPTPRRLLCTLVCASAAGWAALACSAGPPAAPDAWSEEQRGRARALEAALQNVDPGPLAGAGLRVRLAFDAASDLDLYVTDPLQETVYFANTPSRSSGQLDEDLRCGDPSPRIEQVVFPEAPNGRYRIGVDHPERCDGEREAAVFVIETERGGRRELRSGRILPLHFLPIVHELDVQGAGAGPEARWDQRPPVVK